MITFRTYHACGKFKIGDNEVLVVAGVPDFGEVIRKVEFLPLNEPSHWIEGTKIINRNQQSKIQNANFFFSLRTGLTI